MTALLNRAGGVGGGGGADASENSLHQIHLGLGCVFMLFACVCVFVVCLLLSTCTFYVLFH